MKVVPRSALALIALVAIGCADDEGTRASVSSPPPTASSPSPTAKASTTPVSTATPTPVASIAPTATASGQPPSCCQGSNYCRDPGPGAGSFCRAGETALAFPHRCGEESRCALPTATATRTLPVPPATSTSTSTPSATVPTPTFTSTPTEFQATCCQSYSEAACHDPEPYDRFCQFGLDSQPFGSPYRCNPLSGQCELPATPTPTPPGCHQSDPCGSGELCLPQGEPLCLSGPTPTATTTPPCRNDDECTASDPNSVCGFPQPGECRCCSVPRCIDGCSTDDDCGPGQECSVSRHCDARRCSVDSDCPKHFDCLDSGSPERACERRACNADSECPDGFCVRDRCYDEAGTCHLIPQ